MKKLWTLANMRFMAMPRRERALLPGALCFALLMLSYFLVLEPARKEWKATHQRHEQESNDLAVVQAQLQALRARMQNPDAALRAQLELLRIQTRAVDEQFKQISQALVPAQEMGHWLADVLQTQRGLQLIGLRSVPVAPFSESGTLMAATPPAPAKTPAATGLPSLAQAIGNAASASAAAPAIAASAKEIPDAWLYRHGIEITVRGSYADLLACLNAMEHMPRRVYWGELKLDAQQHPAVDMTLTVYTLSLDKKWWVI